MKIAVLFGSFNPLTNAHIDVMKVAMDNLNADKGLFVATNGQYLRKKTVKIGDPFYLTEEERMKIIENVCKSDAKLSFWGFELGGINPKRYKTLYKIQQQYPTAEIYEIEGADKVHTISKFGDAEEYIRNVRFAIFERNEIDLDKLLNQDPLLSQYKDSFVMLPKLENGATISSSEVRKRFYAGEDYSDIIPEKAADILRLHKPTDFTISFAERMKVLMRSGRFGENSACKEIYSENTKLFLKWKEGATEIDFGDYYAFLNNTKIYQKNFNTSDLGTIFPTTQTGCINIDCVDLAEKLIDMGYSPTILNLASARRPGGGYDKGLKAQEESLCRSSNLSLSLYQYADPKKLKCVRDSSVPTKHIGYPLDINFGGIYTPNVTFFRNNKSQFFTIKERSFKCDVITVAALSFNEKSEYADKSEIMYRSSEGGFTTEGKDIMLNKIRTIFRMGVEHGKDSLILGAFGCGAYRLPVSDVVQFFQKVMEEKEFAHKFRLIVFAILESSRKPNGLDGKFGEFYRKFGIYNISSNI